MTQLTSTVLFSGSLWYIVKCDIVGDGTGDLTNSRVNVTTGDMGKNNSLYELHGELTGFSAKLLFDATTKVYATQLPSDVDIHQKFSRQGAIPNNAGTGKTGDILITTNGLMNGASGSFVLKVRKQSK